MGCKLTQNITKDKCQYSVAGIKSIYLYNFDVSNTETIDTDGTVTDIELIENAKAYRVEFIPNTASFSDELAENGNGGKYRMHTLNFSLENYNYELLNQADALSLGTFSAVLVDKSGRAIILGRTNGLNATAFNYTSGAADADANGWTVTMAGAEKEIARLLKNESVIATIVDKTIIEP